MNKSPLDLAHEIVAGGNGQAHSYEDLFKNARAVSQALIDITANVKRVRILATDEDVRIKIKRGTETPESMGPYQFGPTGAELEKILTALGIHVTYTYKGSQ